MFIVIVTASAKRRVIIMQITIRRLDILYIYNSNLKKYYNFRTHNSCVSYILVENNNNYYYYSLQI